MNDYELSSELFLSSKGADCYIRTKAGDLPGHKAVIWAQCKVFIKKTCPSYNVVDLSEHDIEAVQMFFSALYKGNYEDPIAGAATQPSRLCFLNPRLMQACLSVYGFSDVEVGRDSDETAAVVDCFDNMTRKDMKQIAKVTESFALAIRVYRIGAVLDAPLPKLLAQERIFLLLRLILTRDGLDKACRGPLFTALALAVEEIFNTTEARDMIRREVMSAIFSAGDRGDGAHIPYFRAVLMNSQDFLRGAVEAVRFPLKHAQTWQDLIYEVVTEVSGDRMDDDVIAQYPGMEDWV